VTSLKISDESKWITEPMLMAIHALQVERYGGRHGVRDKNAVLSSLARPRHRWADDAGADLADLAAGYLVGFGQAQGFIDGNKRTALACALVFLDINKAPLHVESIDLLTLTMDVATGRADDAKVAAYIRDHLTG
jgi:death-on-curing protein